MSNVKVVSKEVIKYSADNLVKHYVVRGKYKGNEAYYLFPQLKEIHTMSDGSKENIYTENIRIIEEDKNPIVGSHQNYILYPFTRVIFAFHVNKQAICIEDPTEGLTMDNNQAAFEVINTAWFEFATHILTDEEMEMGNFGFYYDNVVMGKEPNYDKIINNITELGDNPYEFDQNKVTLYPPNDDTLAYNLQIPLFLNDRVFTEPADSDFYFSFVTQDVWSNLKLYTKDGRFGFSGVKYQPEFEEVIRWLKGIYTNKERFLSQFVEPILVEKGITWFRESYERGRYCQIPVAKIKYMDKADEIVKRMIDLYDEVEPFTYAEAFEMKDEEFQKILFNSIDINDMMDNIGKKLISTESIITKQIKFGNTPEEDVYSDLNNVYSLYAVDTNSIGLDYGIGYAVNVECPSTGKSHWLWVSGDNTESPLHAIASLARFPRKYIPIIERNGFIRQGDVLVINTDEPLPELSKKDIADEVPLTKEQYFSKMLSQS